MIDKDSAETAALHGSLGLMSDVVSEIGWDVPPKDWTQDQVLLLAEAAVDGFQSALAAIRAGVEA